MTISELRSKVEETLHNNKIYSKFMLTHNLLKDGTESHEMYIDITPSMLIRISKSTQDELLESLLIILSYIEIR